MPLPSFATQDEIPEPFRAAYVERDGEWVPDDSEVAGLKASQRTLLSQKKKATETLAELLGTRSVDEVKALLAERTAATEPDAKRDRPADAEKWAEREKKIRDEFDAKLAPYLEKAKKLEQKEFEDAVWEAAKAAGANESDRKLVLKMAHGDYVTRSDDGKITVLDEYGEPSDDSLKALFEGRFKKENAKLYAPQGGSGGGATAGSTAARSTGAVASDLGDFISRITSDKDALTKAQAGQLTVRSAA